jgi:hypothetical protein
VNRMLHSDHVHARAHLTHSMYTHSSYTQKQQGNARKNKATNKHIHTRTHAHIHIRNTHAKKQNKTNKHTHTCIEYTQAQKASEKRNGRRKNNATAAYSRNKPWKASLTPHPERDANCELSACSALLPHTNRQCDHQEGRAACWMDPSQSGRPRTQHHPLYWPGNTDRCRQVPTRICSAREACSVGIGSLSNTGGR